MVDIPMIDTGSLLLYSELFAKMFGTSSCSLHKVSNAVWLPTFEIRIAAYFIKRGPMFWRMMFEYNTNHLPRIILTLWYYLSNLVLWTRSFIRCQVPMHFRQFYLTRTTPFIYLC